MDDQGRHAENLRMLDRLLSTGPRDPQLHFLRARTLLSLERHEDSLQEVRRAATLGWDDADVLTQAASMCFYAGDLEGARLCADRARALAPGGLVLKDELRALRRHLSRREKRSEAEKGWVEAFEQDPADADAALQLARHLRRTGRTYSAYHVIARALHHRPSERALLRLEGKLRADVPDQVRADALRWAASGELFSVSNRRADGASTQWDR